MIGWLKAADTQPFRIGLYASMLGHCGKPEHAGVIKALLADPDIKSFDINVVTSKGEVQLTGFVDNQSQIDRATAVARAAEGAGSVRNELMVKP